MTLKLQIILICGLVIVIALILNMVRRRKLELKYALAWLICDLVLIVLTCIPPALTGLAELMGIYSPVNMVFFLGFIFMSIIVFVLTVSLSRVTAKVRRLAQMEALTSKQAEENVKENSNSNNIQSKSTQ